MDLSTQLHLAAGLAAVGLGGAALLRDPRRRRNRLFAALCAALAVWTFGAAGYLTRYWPDIPWHRVYVLGSCAAAPLGLHFTLALASPGRRPPVYVLVATYTASLGLYLAAWGTGPDLTDAWRTTAMVVLGSILMIALGVIFRLVLSARPGPERRTYRLFLLGGVVAVVGGMSDFIPREESVFPRIGPMALMIFLLILCSAVLRHRFLDVDRFLARAAALITGAAAAALLLFLVARSTDAKFFPLFITSLVILAVAGPVGKVVLSGARTLLSPGDPAAGAFLTVSRSLQSAGSAAEVWEALEEGRKVLPDRIRVLVYVRSSAGDLYLPRYATGAESEGREVPAEAPLAELLRAERSPVTRRFLEEEAMEEDGARRGLVSGALTALAESGNQMAVPLMRGGDLAGWIEVGGLPERSVTADMAGAFLAVGNQAMAGLERLEAMEAAERRRAMAAVGEMAAGLAHEIRNPLAAIHGAAQALGPEAKPEQSREMLEVIEEESDRLGRVVGEFLHYARPGRPERQPVDLAAMAGRVARSASLGGFDLNIEVEAEPGTPSAHADPDQVLRAFENLVRNAWEAAGSGGNLHVAIRRGTPGRVEARFRDDGPGIEDGELSKVFQPFHSTKRGGTGLGLALVHRIVEGHDGSVHVESRPGRGATFTLAFPAAEETT